MRSKDAQKQLARTSLKLGVSKTRTRGRGRGGGRGRGRGRGRGLFFLIMYFFFSFLFFNSLKLEHGFFTMRDIGIVSGQHVTCSKTSICLMFSSSA